ncbi:hypothetical protein N7520_005532 [Penicillium odoratum]|uniref:uncharacterized protein n=1 Tax=Penicillium odoratum TaxID=1167516 RepID=UPI0025491149|nr:uncharacterized protein N7520_005532 [Penicillium odoratum]KAJ5758376.1 hypothetical protein N7520_005532 [Penicillium odoratum]
MTKVTVILTALFASSAMALSIPDQYGVIGNITAWLGDIDCVNLFLERAAAGLSTDNLRDEAVIAWTCAEDEPTRLNDLKELPGLSKAGRDAATTLGEVFPAVPGNLTDIIAHPGDKREVKKDLENINTLRCTQVLPNIDVLWAAAADLAKWPAVPAVPRPTTC